VQAPKPSPASFAKEAYFGVTAFRFFNQRNRRYRFVPQAGIEHHNDVTAA
jgi:catalase